MLLGTAVLIALAAFFLIKGSWWMSASLVALWLALEWWGVWTHEKQRRVSKQRKEGATLL